MDDKGMIKRLSAFALALLQNPRVGHPMGRESRRPSRKPSHTGSPTVGTLGAFGGTRKRLGDGHLDPSKACAKAGRRGGKADPKFGTRVGERG